MKKIYLLSMILALPFLFNSCEKEVVYDSTYSAEYDISPRMWVYDENTSSYSVSLDVPEITRQVCQYGSVQCFLVYSDKMQACIPLTRYLSGVNDYDELVYYQEHYDFEYGVGVVNMFFQTSDFVYNQGDLQTMTFRVVVHY